MIKKKCKVCGKVVEGYTENQVEHMLAVHTLSKHKKERTK